MLVGAVPESSELLAPVIAAVIAAAAAVVLGITNIVVTVRQSQATRDATQRLADREQWWLRFTWAAGELFAADEQRALVAVSVLNALAAVPWISQDDQDMILGVFDQLNAEVYGREAKETGNA